MYKIYCRKDDSQIDANGNERVIQLFFEGQPGFTYDSNTDVLLTSSAPERGWVNGKEFTAPQGTEYDAYAYDGTSVLVEWIGTLQEAKDAKIAEIQERTDELIEQGFTFDSKVFSLSLSSRTYWIGIKAIEPLVTWPLNVETISDESYTLSQANLDSFLGTALATIQANFDSGTTLKNQVLSATNIADVNAVTDSR